MADNYAGVVSLRISGETQASGVLLWTGRHILTAAHFTSKITDISALSIAFNQTVQPTGISALQIISHPGWDANPSNYNHDLAIISLNQRVSQISGYELYRDYNEIGREFTRVGYSADVDPLTGEISNGNKTFHSGTNRYDTGTDAINPFLGTTVAPGLQLSYDFDNGLKQQDAYGQILGLEDTGNPSSETLARTGDSGGPAFIDDKIAGIASYIFRYESADISPDVTPVVDSSYGEMASDTRISHYAAWLDSQIMADYTQQAPTQKDAVERYVIEGSNGANSLNYFLLELSAPLNTPAMVNYETISKTAIAGEDFVASRGVAIIPAGQRFTTIGIEIIADNLSEQDETFQIKITNPQGGLFPDNVEALYAEHTIIDDDHEYILSRETSLKISGIPDTDEDVYF